MCGIIGMASLKDFTSKEILSRLKKLEYRGYDSYGYFNNHELVKKVGSIMVIDDEQQVKTAISHTRWATHGGVSEKNSHPHQQGIVTIVHNGIIDNWRELKEELVSKGVVFVSETDSEVVAALLNFKLQEENKKIEESIKELLNELKGTFAILAMIKNVEGHNKIYALKRDSPLTLGLTKNEIIIASDIYAFSDLVQEAFFFENNEYAIISSDGFLSAEFFDKKGNSLKKKPKKFSWIQEEETIEEYEHFMLKEIHEEPKVQRRLVESLKLDQEDCFNELVNEMKKAKQIVFTAAGTAYFASLLGTQFLRDHGVRAQAIIASEFENFVFVDEKTLVIAVTQSGETMDVIEALKFSKKNGARIASIVNVPFSTIERMSDVSINILAGQEVAVASTKAFTNQATTILAIAKAFGYENGLEKIPEKIGKVLKKEEEIKNIAKKIYDKKDLYVLGRSLGYPLAREIALKIKEVSYTHAEGMMAGELKHGTIALIEEDTPVIGLVYNNDSKMRGSLQEVKARGANVIIIGNTIGSDIFVEAKTESGFVIAAATAGQLLAYHIAKLRGLPIDKPRNLAKSVTVL